MVITTNLPQQQPGQSDTAYRAVLSAHLNGFNTARHCLTVNPRGILKYKVTIKAPSTQRRDRRKNLAWDEVRRLEDTRLQRFLDARRGGASDSETGGPPTLGKNCKNPVNECSVPKSGFGTRPLRKRFGKSTRDRAMDAAAAIENACGIAGCLMVTFTLPGSLYAARVALESYSALVIERLRQLLKQWEREEPDSEFGMVSVWEYQERGALHLHVLIGHRHKDGSPVHVERIRYTGEYLRWEWWPLLLCEISDLAGVDMFAKHRGFTWGHRYHEIGKHCVDYQFVKKSVRDYFGKYLGKDDGKGDKLGPDPAYGPTSWVHVNGTARRWVDEQTLRLTLPSAMDGTAPRLIADAISACEELDVWHRPRVNPITREVVGVSAAGTTVQMWELAMEIEERARWIVSHLPDGFSALRERWRDRWRSRWQRVAKQLQVYAEETYQQALEAIRRRTGLKGLIKFPSSPSEWQSNLAT